MTAVNLSRYTGNYSGYFANGAAKTSAAPVAPKTANVSSGNVSDGGKWNNGDSVTISLAAGDLHQQHEILQSDASDPLGIAEKIAAYRSRELPIEYRSGLTFGLSAAITAFSTSFEKSSELSQYREKHSAHFDINAWAGISENNLFTQEFSIGQERKHALTNYSLAQSSLKRVDEEISGILQKNNIALSKDESLSFAVNHEGKIVVGKGMEESKRSRIEQLLNEDTALSRELFNAYGFRSSVENWETHPSHPQQLGTTVAASAILRQNVNTILQREYGLSLDDFEKNPDIKDPENNLALRSKSGNNTLVQKMHEEEFALYESIYSVLNQEGSHEFSIDFLYKNGITLQKGTSDQASLDEIPEKIAAREWLEIRGAESFSITVNPTGIIKNSTVFVPNDTRKLSRDMKMSLDWQNRQSMVEAEGKYNVNSRYLNQPTLQQYATDMQRLMQFKTGIDAANMQDFQVTFGKSGGQTFTVASANRENLPPMQITIGKATGVSLSILA